jgi:hypothetical protein
MVGGGGFVCVANFRLPPRPTGPIPTPAPPATRVHAYMYTPSRAPAPPAGPDRALSSTRLRGCLPPRRLFCIANDFILTTRDPTDRLGYSST